MAVNAPADTVTLTIDGREVTVPKGLDGAPGRRIGRDRRPHAV